MKRRIIVAVTGHRDIVETEELSQKVFRFFEELLAKSEELVLLSPLADGADRFVAKIFLELQKRHEHLLLIAPMPFSKERYMRDFDQASKEEFLELLEVVNDSFQIASMGDKPYQELGKYIVNVSDTLLALWDGTYNGKAGGTGDVVEYAQGMGKAKVVHFLCERQG